MVQPSIVALGAALFGIVLQTYGAEYRFVYIIGTACIMGAFVIAVTAFLLVIKDWIFPSGQPVNGR
ncbi:MAG TPA: hypothetical protein P5217_03390 [Methanoregulaceae archaeon]|nr:hypothetical protein [Methanoregulaceae archaeon]HPD74821.1 hypothetical protein [Methanoregulaceae archaeon]HRY75304.1 hypothetical protein [Methanoregulaceae archaeon]